MSGFGDFMAAGSAGAGLGGTLGSAIPGVGTAVGAGLGFIGGGLSTLFGTESSGRKFASESGEPARVDLDPAAFGAIQTSDLDFDQARGELGGMRYVGGSAGGRDFETVREQQALNMLGARAQGRDLISEQVAGQQQDAARQAIASQLATAQRGGFDPNLQRLAMQQTGQAQQGIANQATVAGAQEQLAAQQAFANATRQQAQSNLGFLQAGVAGQAVDAQREANLLNLKRMYAAQGFSEEEANRQAQMQYQISQGQFDQSRSQAAFQADQRAAERQAAESAANRQGMLTGGATALSFLASRPQKEKQAIKVFDPGLPESNSGVDNFGI